MAFVTTPFSTRVRLTAWRRGKQQTSEVNEQPAFFIWYAKWMDAFVPPLLPRVASFQSVCSDFFRTENTRMTISGVNTARHCRIQTHKKREKHFNNEGSWASIERFSLLLHLHWNARHHVSDDDLQNNTYKTMATECVYIYWTNYLQTLEL